MFNYQFLATPPPVSPSIFERLSRRLYSAAFVSALALSLSACGGGDNDNPSPPDSSETHSDSSNSENLEEFREQFIKSTAEDLDGIDLPGVTVAVARSNGELWSHGFGYANLETEEPLTPNVVQGAASLSKMVTATAAMQAVEEGLLDLDDDINRTLPFSVENPHRLGAPITLRQLLTHTSGIVDNPEVYQSTVVYKFGDGHPPALDDFLKDYLMPEGEYYSVEANFLDSDPGETASYSNIAFSLVGLLVATVKLKPFSETTRETILEPLGMDSSGWRPSEVDVSETSLQYGLKDGPYVGFMEGEAIGQWRAYKPLELATYPDGGLLTSVTDFSRFMAAIMNGGKLGGARILKAESVETMLTLRDLGADDAEYLQSNGVLGQALGFAYHDLPGIEAGATLIGHTGGDPGRRTFAYFDPATEIAVVLFMNSDPPSEESADVIHETLLDLFDNADALIGDGGQ